MTTTKGDQEPSMEEILSSIRRIIADEQEGGAAAAQPEPPPAMTASPEAEEEDVLDLTQVIDEADADSVREAAPAMNDEFDDDDIGFEPPMAAPPPAEAEESSGETAESGQVMEETVLESDRDEDGSIVSGETASRSTDAFARLAKAASSAEERRPPIAAGERSIEGFVGDMLRPMLKEWLDQNLEGIVERVVEQEVKKFARRAELL